MKTNPHEKCEKEKKEAEERGIQKEMLRHDLACENEVKQQALACFRTALAEWIDGNTGVSSEAIYLYMTVGKSPAPFSAPSDSGDRGRCIVLLRAVPEWIPRLKEIEKAHIQGTRNGEIVEPWNEQIPLLLDELLKQETK